MPHTENILIKRFHFIVSQLPPLLSRRRFVHIESLTYDMYHKTDQVFQWALTFMQRTASLPVFVDRRPADFVLREVGAYMPKTTRGIGPMQDNGSQACAFMTGMNASIVLSTLARIDYEVDLPWSTYNWDVRGVNEGFRAKIGIDIFTGAVAETIRRGKTAVLPFYKKALDLLVARAAALPPTKAWREELDPWNRRAFRMPVAVVPFGAAQPYIAPGPAVSARAEPLSASGWFKVSGKGIVDPCDDPTSTHAGGGPSRPLHKPSVSVLKVYRALILRSSVSYLIFLNSIIFLAYI